MVGAIYDVGKVNWLPESKVGEILKKVSESPERALNPMAERKQSSSVSVMSSHR